jgi:TrbL/VirB6 plasmid conjugal transfer protein
MGTEAQIFNYISDLLALHGGQFQYIGLAMFTGFATIMVVWFGVKSALTAGEVVGGFHFGKFADLLFLIAFGYGMINYYNTPIPGFGQSFPQLVTNESKYLTSLIGDTALQNAQLAVTNYSKQFALPSIVNVTASYEYVLVEMIVAFWKFVSIAVNLLGPVATAVAVLLGPLFIPFFIVPNLEFLFWGWLKFFLAYSFYQVVAAAVTYILCNVVVYALQFPPFFPLPLDYMDMISALAILLLGGSYILLKVPALTNHLFSGTAGLSPTSDIFSGIAALGSLR